MYMVYPLPSLSLAQAGHDGIQKVIRLLQIMKRPQDLPISDEIDEKCPLIQEPNSQALGAPGLSRPKKSAMAPRTQGK
jgi:hypothetical protein